VQESRRLPRQRHLPNGTNIMSVLPSLVSQPASRKSRLFSTAKWPLQLNFGNFVYPGRRAWFELPYARGAYLDTISSLACFIAESGSAVMPRWSRYWPMEALCANLVLISPQHLQSAITGTQCYSNACVRPSNQVADTRASIGQLFDTPMRVILNMVTSSSNCQRLDLGDGRLLIGRPSEEPS